MLELDSITTAAGAFRIRDVTLRISAGKCHALLGPSGAGKTTLLNTVLGVIHPESGRVILDGTDITRSPIEQRGLGYVPQHLGLFPHLTVRENITYSARARGLPASDFQPLADQLVGATGIGALLDRLPSTLSGGEKQRVGIVRALAGRPRLVLLDEPFTALDESLRRELWHLIRNLRQQQGLTILLVTHNLAEAGFLADDISILLAGRVVQQGDKPTVFERPATAEVARFLGVENLLPARVVEREGDLVLVEISGVRFLARAPDHECREVLACVRAEDVALASKKNHTLIGNVVSVQQGRPMISVEVDVGFRLQAMISRAAFDELACESGARCPVHIPPAAVHLIPFPHSEI